MSDRTWSVKWGRRRPYFLVGAILSSISLFFVPNSPALWVAAGFLWILDASINVAMEPFRALVADKLPQSQRSYGFVVQTLIIGIGTWVASNLPWMVSQFGVSNEAEIGIVPMSVKVAFAIGAFVFLASILYTVFTTDEYPPEDMEEFKKEKAKKNNFIPDILNNIGSMPTTMKKLGVIQFFSWFAFFTMWSLANPALTEHVYQTPAPIESAYNMADNIQAEAFKLANTQFQESSNLVGSAMGIYGLSSMAFALLLTLYTSKRNINRKYVHMVSLMLGGIGFLYMNYASPETLIYSFILIGFAWGSILSMPYAMLSSSVDPKKMGVIMGIFNMFIVIPQIIAALGGINYVSNLLGEAAINAMTVAGISLVIAGLCNFLITNKNAISYQEEN
jgi:maltose/moltooligosaccharide transporter